MDKRNLIGRYGFWVLALLWLPAGVMAQAAVRFLPEPGAGLQALSELVLVAPCGLPLALGCRRLWRLRYRRAVWLAGIGLGAVTIAATLVAGLLGPIATAVYAAVLALPVWIAVWWLARLSDHTTRSPLN